MLLALIALGAALFVVAWLADGQRLIRYNGGWVRWDDFMAGHPELV